MVFCGIINLLILFYYIDKLFDSKISKLLYKLISIRY